MTEWEALGGWGTATAGNTGSPKPQGLGGAMVSSQSKILVFEVGKEGGRWRQWTGWRGGQLVSSRALSLSAGCRDEALRSRRTVPELTLSKLWGLSPWLFRSGVGWPESAKVATVLTL
jgi:hypothetical protein